ncbi:MAG: hypothetical protein JW783_14270 [Bacteroidales bacterium]|nr:hypothetical protein [Bacteroidales bacterium]MBN2749719.1 hypothetical protein [Bacteroidales bacterium]
MDSKLQKLDCPICGNHIFFEVTRLLKGESFSCPNCQSAISLSSSSTTTVERAMVELEKFSVKHNITTKK